MKIMHDDKKINAMQDQGAENATDISALQEAVGDEDSGLIKAVADLETEKATLSDVETLLASGDVEDIKADSIIENMTGYTYSGLTKENLTTTTEFAGIVKTGNKLTLVWFGYLTRTGSVQDGWAPIASFNLPESIANKLAVHSITGMPNSIDDRVITAYSTQTSKVDLNGHITRVNTAIAISLFGMASLTENTAYAVRYEATFLLCDNMAA